MNERPFEDLASPLGIKGPWAEIFAVVEADGRCPVMEWLDGSDAGTRARYALRFRRLCNEGQFKMRGDTFHRLDDRGIPGASELFEFKDLASQSRILCFFDGEKVVLLAYAFGGKKEDKTRPGEILQGLKARSSYLKRAVRHQQGSAAFGWKRRRQR